MTGINHAPRAAASAFAGGTKLNFADIVVAKCNLATRKNFVHRALTKTPASPSLPPHGIGKILDEQIAHKLV
jgi:hypothetical protein